MKLAVFGATGRTGTRVVEQALAAGHDVVAAARRPAALRAETQARHRLVVIRCDVLDAADVSAALHGADAVICTIGPSSNRKPGTLISTGTRNLLAGCEGAGISRFVFQSGIMLTSGRELSWTGRLTARTAGLALAALKADKVAAETAITNSSLDWVIVRAPALKDSARSSVPVAAPAARISPAKSISFADCAAALIDAATNPEWVRQIVNVGRP